MAWAKYIVATNPTVVSPRVEMRLIRLCRRMGSMFIRRVRGMVNSTGILWERKGLNPVVSSVEVD